MALTASTADLQAQTAANIAKAHTLTHPEKAPNLEWENFHHLLKTRVAQHSTSPYIIFHDESGRIELSYAQFYARCCKVAHVMEGLGLKAGDRIGTVAYNHPDTVVIYFAAWLLGVVVIPFNAGDGDDRMVYSFNNGLAKALFAKRKSSALAAEPRQNSRKTLFRFSDRANLLQHI